MKLRSLFVLAILAVLLTACNFTLAADVTPPPGYVAPAAEATSAPVTESYPAAAFDVKNGAEIYVTECAPCHGDTGLGDGALSSNLDSVPALGTAALAQKASPVAWYQVVTQGNMAKMMPPFSNKLSEQGRWDVAAYALSLHTTPEQISAGKALVDANCADCTAFFSNPQMMSVFSENDLIDIMKTGGDGIPAFGKNFTADESVSAAMYISTMSFSAPVVAAQPTSAPAATAAPESGTPAAETTPAGIESAATEASVTAEPAAGIGNVSGSVDNQTGAALPSDVKIILHAYEHGGDMSAGPTELNTVEGTLNSDGTYLFENVELPESRIFVAEAVVNGLSYQSGFALVEAGMANVTLEPIVVFTSTDDFSTLKIASLQIGFDFATEGNVTVFAMYSIINDSGKTITVDMGENQEIPFLPFPKNATQPGYEVGQNSASLVMTETGFAMPPSTDPYELVAVSSFPKSKEIVISQPALLAIDEVTLFLPEGVTAEGKTLTDDGIKPMQDVNFHLYTSSKLEKGESLEFTLTGAPSTSTAVNPDVTQNKNLLIGVGAFGLVLIVLGAWLFIRDRNKAKADEDDDEEEDDSEEDADVDGMMDAIIALDDLHRSGKISDEAYKTRRAELKSKLKK